MQIVKPRILFGSNTHPTRPLRASRATISAFTVLALAAGTLLGACNGIFPISDAPPEMISSNPSSGATAVPLDSKVSVSFSKPILSATLTLKPNVSLGGAVWDSKRMVVTYTPTVKMAVKTLYTVEIDGKDLVGQSLNGTKSFTFTTGTTS